MNTQFLLDVFNSLSEKEQVEILEKMTTNMVANHLLGEPLKPIEEIMAEVIVDNMDILDLMLFLNICLN